MSALEFRHAVQEETCRELRRAAADLPVVVYAEAPLGVIGRLGRHDPVGLSAVGKARLASECALALGRVGAARGGLLLPVVADTDRVVVLVGDRTSTEAVTADVTGKPRQVVGWSEPTMRCDGLFADALLDGMSGRACPDCAVMVGAAHRAGCDVARCSGCRGQHLSCGCDAPAEPWAGEWPGVYECRVLGFYARRGERGWESCAADAPGARADLNRLAAYWARDAVGRAA